MSLSLIDRPPTAPRQRAGFGRRLRIRLSNGHSWAHEFEADGPFSLREGCADAHFEHRCYAEALSGQFPPHQTRNRERVRAEELRKPLYLHVQHGSQWLNANYATNSEWFLTVRAPGESANGEAWPDADWADAWIRCERCKSAAEALDRFCRDVGDFLDGELS